MHGHLDNVEFDQIRYANVWEDPHVLLHGLNLPSNKRILSIASAGDNAFALLTTHPEMVVAFDISQTQLFLVELKKVAIEHLSREDCAEFLGFEDCAVRLLIFQHLEQFLSEYARNYWNTQLIHVDKGVIHMGKFEHYFQLFSNRVMPFIHGQKVINQLFQKKSAAEQEQFYNEHWNTRSWRLFFKIFFSKRVMGNRGRDPEFLKQVSIDVSDYIFQMAETELKSVNAHTNNILHYTLNGEFGELLPFYLLEENYDTIKNNLDKLHLFKGFPNEAIEKYGKFDGFNLSDIFEYMDRATFEKVTRELINGANDNAKFAYWNLMVPRRMSSLEEINLRYLNDLSSELTKIDKGFFYNQFLVDEYNA